MKRCYIFDIDGTIANGDHRLHHIVGPCPACVHCLITPLSVPCPVCGETGQKKKDWETYFAACGDDAPIRHVIRVLRCVHRGGHGVVLVSGRSDVCRELTIDWLSRCAVPYDALYMRAEGDHTDDDKLKIQMLAQLRADGWEPQMAFDDRTRVVNAWRAAGVPCAQVAPGDF
jgi:hypothetical protein